MKKRYIPIIILLCLSALAVTGCGSKKSGSSKDRAKAQTEINGKTEKSEAKENKRLEMDREKLYSMRREYRELARKVMNTPDPMERSRISDKMDRLNRQIGDLEVEMLQKYGKPY